MNKYPRMEVRLQTVGGCHPKGSGGTNHFMATKLAITTNKHKTQTVTRCCFLQQSSRGTRVDMAICSWMQKWKTKPDILQMIVG